MGENNTKSRGALRVAADQDEDLHVRWAARYPPRPPHREANHPDDDAPPSAHRHCNQTGRDSAPRCAVIARAHLAQARTELSPGESSPRVLGELQEPEPCVVPVQVDD